MENKYGFCIFEISSNVYQLGVKSQVYEVLIDYWVPVKDGSVQDTCLKHYNYVCSNILLFLQYVL